MVSTAELVGVEVVVSGRNVMIPSHYRQHVVEKLTKLERYDHKLTRLEVELFHEPNRRQSEHCQRVEITGRSRGPVIRAEATAKDFYTALDNAVEKIARQMRRAADRRRVHHGRRTPISVAAATAPLADYDVADLEAQFGDAQSSNGAGHELHTPLLDGDGPGLVRRKEHPAEPMTVEQALYEMELVGHDFYLFVDKETSRPSVVYRRKGYAYGLLAVVP